MGCQKAKVGRENTLTCILKLLAQLSVGRFLDRYFVIVIDDLVFGDLAQNLEVEDRLSRPFVELVSYRSSSRCRLAFLLVIGLDRCSSVILSHVNIDL